MDSGWLIAGLTFEHLTKFIDKKGFRKWRRREPTVYILRRTKWRIGSDALHPHQMRMI